jgi:uncharacterized protein (TIGR02145 family)
MITIAIAKKTTVVISAFDFSGRSVFTVHKTLDIGNQSIALPQRGRGIYLYKVKAGDREFVLKGNAIGGVSYGCSAITGEAFSKPLSKQGKTTESIDDVIAVTKDGYFNYSCSIVNYDSEVIIKIIMVAGKVTDADGNDYQCVKIGNQVWMAENLRTTRYNNGTAIPHGKSTESWTYATTPKFCFYNNTTNSDSIKMYGALYNWFVVDPSNPLKIAPKGWHVPSDAEWDTLQNYLIANGYNWDGTTMGNKIAKSLAAQTDWYQCLSDGVPCKDSLTNNRSGFSAFAGGYRQGSDGYSHFQSLQIVSYWWSEPYVASWGRYRYLNYSSSGLGKDVIDGRYGLSVRLVKD